MSRIVSVVAIATVVLGVAPVPAQQVRQAGTEGAAQNRQQTVQAEKLGVGEQILQAREQAQQRGGFDVSFRRYWTDQLTRLSTP